MFINAPFTFPRHSLSPRNRRGVALVLTLAAVVLICAIILVFFTESTLNRRISFSSAGQYQADIAAHTAMDTIVGDLRSEITAGSTAYVNNGYTIYVPTNNITAVPCRVADQGFVNVVKKSSAQASFWSGSSYSTATVPVPIRSASNNNSLDHSSNGRYIDVNRWNAPYLLGASLPNSFTPPDWVVITRKGAIANVDASMMPTVTGQGGLADKTLANQNYAVGRYAYVAYDEGGLLDINVAGFPAGSGVPADFSTKRGVLPQVDITTGLIPGLDASSATSLLQWRNQASASSYGADVLNATNGFTTPFAPGDQVLVNRQDLINYATNSGLASSTLQYLGTFSREINAPSYAPPPLGSPSRPAVNANPGGAAAAAIGQDDAFNPSLINVRVTTPFIRYSDNTNTAAGEPLIKYRFPLSRLALVTYNATGDTSSNIYKFFGLTRTSASGPWIYRNGATTILTLSGVASAGREPDFFELLQAAIRLGSLGKAGGNTVAAVQDSDMNVFHQVIQIGANVIAQYQTASYPPRISFDSTEFDGIENLPYLMRVFNVAYRFKNSATVGIWEIPEVWNPHSGAGSPPSTPSQFRFIVTSGVNPPSSSQSFVYFYSSPTPSSFPPAVNPPPPTAFSPVPPAFVNSQGITFTSTGYNFGVPTILQTLKGIAGATASGNDNISDARNGGVNFIGICFGEATAPDYRNGTSTDPNSLYYWAAYYIDPAGISYELQYWDGSQWITYSRMRTLVAPGGFADWNQTAFQGPLYINPCETIADPRSDRFGALFQFNGSPYTDTLRPNAAEGHWTVAPETPGEWVGWSDADGTIQADNWTLYAGCLSDNLASGPTSYVDCDGILRLGDGAYTQGIAGSVSSGGYPEATDSFNNPYSRPVMLNRPFRSVAEMGYAFRDDPWKSLDFFTSQSGDSALLDLFCLNESPPPPYPIQSTNPLAQAGRVDLNTRQQPVLQAVLAGAIKAEDDSTPISPTEAGTLATNLVNLTSTLPLLNRNELVTRWISDPSINSYSSTTDTTLKRRREAAIRALSDIGNTRTWNLLIDVIAQSGRYGPTASTLDQFTVDGERRYWLHVAIDRYTGKVVAQSLEPVYE